MNQRIPKEEKAKNAGISLEPKLIADSKALAKKLGKKSISVLARELLTKALKEANAAAEREAQKVERARIKLEEKTRGKKK